MFKKIFLLLSFTYSILSFGQGETANWYFGNGAGITFNIDGSVTPVIDGKLVTLEGCASISNAAGELLFYTDGIRVYNREHNIMQNGTGLYGDPSSTQSAIIVPKPEDPNLLYIFTVDTSTSENDPNRGLNYSIVDMSEDNGLGAVIIKNINLLRYCSEKIAAVVKDCFDKSLWVVTLSTEDGKIGDLLNTYHAFEVNPIEVVRQSVKTTFNDLEIEDPRGYLKLSADGSKIASANAFLLYLYDFDPATGILSNQERLTIDSNNRFAYGLEFSPSQQYLYVHTSNNLSAQEETGHSSSLIQFDLLSPEITNSQVEIDKRDMYRGALQLGGNGKIYRTITKNYFEGTSFLGVINNPDEKGMDANYVHNAISLNGRNGTQGLPPFIQSFFEKTGLIKNSEGNTVSALEICETNNIILEAELYPDATYVWEKDGVPLGNSNNIYEINDLEVSDSGIYRVDITFSDPKKCPIIGESFIAVNKLPSSETFSLTQCDIKEVSNGIGVFNLEEAFYDSKNIYILYETELDRNNDIPIESTSEYINQVPFNQNLFYRAISENGCESSGVLELSINAAPLSSSPDVSIYSCDDEPNDEVLESSFDLSSIAVTNYPDLDVVFYESIEDINIEKNALPNEFRTESKTIYARLENLNQCIGVDVIDLVVNPTPFFEFPEEFLWCTDGNPLEVSAPEGFDSYTWMTKNGNQNEILENNQNISLTNTGIYTLEVGYEYIVNNEIQYCTYRRNFEVLPSNKAKIEDVIVKDITDNNSVELIVSGDGTYEYSLDGLAYQDSSIFYNLTPGFITVYVKDKNGCGVIEKLISVVGYPKFFTPNGDGQNDIWQLKGVEKDFQANTIISIFNRYGKVMDQIAADESGWNGTFNGSPLPASDYWFSATLGDGRKFNGHFSLKR